MTTRSKARVYRRDPRPLKQGACPVCFQVVAVNTTGLRRLHRDGQGGHCPGSGVRVETLEVPAELLSSVRIDLAPEGRCANSRAVTGRCHDCDRAVTGERRFCGPCVARREM